MKAFTAPTVLVIDDVGLLPIGGTEASPVFFQVVNTRYERGRPTIVTTNRGLPDRGTIFGDTEATWPLAIVQTCVLHLIRNTFRLASRADWDMMARVRRSGG